MPFTSAQVSGLVGGQQAMFANDRSFSEQIAGMPALPMQNPYPTYANAPHDTLSSGAGIAGGIGMALPGIAAGGTMAASLLGYKSTLGLLDPFTGVTRAFGAGTGGSMAARAGVMAGAEGMGIKYAAGNIGRAFAQGGLRAGFGAIGGGLAGMALPLAGYYAAGKAISFMGENIYQGAQNIQDVSRMTEQYFQPQFGRAGVRPGGKPGMGLIRQVTDTLQEFASQDTMRSMEDMRRLMDRAGQMGMLEGVGDARQFKDKFRKILKSTKAVAKVLGSSLEEAMPFVKQMEGMGLWTARDVMGTAAEARALGPQGAQAMMGAMQTGAQMAHAMGGRLGAGANLGRQLYAQVAAGKRMGTFSEEDIREFTGGVGGAQGQQMMAGSMQQVMAGMGRTALGRLMMAGLGEIKEGRFTGRMDEERLEQMRTGQLTIGQLQSQGKARIRNQELAASFFNREGQMSQAMGAQGGLELLNAGLQRALQRAGRSGAGPEIKNRFIQLLTGANQRQADALQRMLEDLPRIQDERERRLYASLEDSFREGDLRRNRSWAGFKDAVGQAFEDMGRPFQEFGQNLSISMTEMGDRMSSYLTGRARAMPRVTEQEMMTMRLQGQLNNAPTMQQLGITNIGQGFMDPGVLGNMTMDMRRQGLGRRIFGGMAAGAIAGGVAGTIIPGAGTVSGAVLGGIGGGLAGAMGFDPIYAMQVNARGGMEAGGLRLTGGEAADLLPRARAFLQAGLQARRGTAGANEVSLGGGLVAKSDDLQLVARRAVMRARSATISGLLGGETEEKREAQNVINSRLRKILTDPSQSSALKELKDDRPEEYARTLMRKVSSTPEGRRAVQTLTKDHPMGAGSEGALLDVGAIAMRETGAQGGDRAIDYDETADMLSGMALGTPEELAERQRELFDDMAAGSGAFGGALAAAGTGAAVGAAAGAAFFGVGAIVGGAIGGVIGLGVGLLGHMGTRDMSAGDFESALTSDKYTTQDVVDYLEGKGDTAFAAAAMQGDPAAQKLRNYLDDAKSKGGGAVEELKGQLSEAGRLRRGQARNQEVSRLKRLAGRLGPVGDIKGVRAETESQLEKARKALAAGSMEEGFEMLGKVSMTDVERQKLRGGQDLLGRQAVLQQDIAGMGEMEEKEFKQFKKKLLKGTGGVDLLGSIQASLQGEERVKFEQMLKGGIKGEEVGELKKLLERAAPQVFGKGGQKGKDPMLALMTEYTDANRKFVWAVAEALDGKLKETAEGVEQAGDKMSGPKPA